MENPSIVGIINGWGVVAPSTSVVNELVLPSLVTCGFYICAFAHSIVGGTPVLQVGGGIVYDTVGLEVGMLILEDGIGEDFVEVGREPAHGEGYLGPLGVDGGELLFVYRDVLGVAVVVLNKLKRLHEPTARDAVGVVDIALVGFDLDHVVARPGMLVDTVPAGFLEGFLGLFSCSLLF